MATDQTEQQPLLASYAPNPNDPESALPEPEEIANEKTSVQLRARTAETLESPVLHKTVIALVRRRTFVLNLLEN
jgi:hypothetical protein